MKTETYHRARQSIMHYIMEFCITKHWPDSQKNTPSIKGFVPSGYGKNKVEVGDLVIISSTRTWSKWQIGWLREIGSGYNNYLIESLEDQQLGWCGNVSIEYLQRDVVSAQDDWRWTDRQFAFCDKWDKVCFKEKDAYIIVPMRPVFGEGYKVTLRTRTRFSLDDVQPEKTFPDWRKVTKVIMREWYDECVSIRDMRKKMIKDILAQEIEPSIRCD